MRIGLYSVYDKIAKEYGPTFEAVNENTAKRSFMQLIQKVYNPADYILCQLGFFNTDQKFLVPEYKK